MNADQTTGLMPTTALLFPEMPGVFLRAAVYDPTWGDPSYAAYVGKRIVPPVDSIVKDPDGTPHWVVAISDTFIPTYQDFKVDNSAINGISFYNMDNGRLCLYFDTRSVPYVVTPDEKFLIEGISPRSYQLVRYPGTSQEIVISKYYDTTGTYTSQTIPLVKVSNDLNLWYLQSCRIDVLLAQNEEIRVDIIDETGAVVRQATMFATQSRVINDALIYRPMITGMTVVANQQLADGTFFLYQNQNKDSLHFTITLTYSDGTTRDVVVGKDNCYLYGMTDLLSSFPGLKQELTIRYVLGASEVAQPDLVEGTIGSVYKEIPIVVIPNTVASVMKISLVPVWNTATNRYMIKYYLYIDGQSGPIDITTNITYPQNSLNPTPAYFGQTQSVVVSVDLSRVSGLGITTKSVYQQSFVVIFNPNTAAIKWLIQDTQTSTFCYGQNSTIAKRPVLVFDALRKQYFIPTSIFGNSAAFLESFYYQAAPTYDPTTASVPLTPTHFLIRDPMGGAIKVAAPIPLDAYATAFSVLGDASGNYVGGTLMVEFVVQNTNGTYTALFGAPVDVTTGTYSGS